MGGALTIVGVLPAINNTEDTYMVYIKFSNGSVNQLVNMNNEVAQNEAIENGFYMVMDDNGVPEVVESETLLANRNEDRAAMLAAIANKLANKSKANQTRHK